jgi:hypothetical protein
MNKKSTKNKLQIITTEALGLIGWLGANDIFTF